MVRIIWSFFANQHGIITAPRIYYFLDIFKLAFIILNFQVLLIGGLLSIIGRYFWWPVGIHSLVISFTVFLLEYPISGKPSNSRNLAQTNHSRPYQHLIGNLLSKLGFFYVNYLPRTILYFVFSIPCLLSLSTILPGINLLITTILYLIAFLKNESWIKVEKKEEIYRKITILQAPERPPPRTFNELD